jgi:hypothetical protein
MRDNMIIYEVEIAPHFLTIYSKQLPEMLESAKTLYRQFIIAKPELASIQQLNFVHEENDPNVYHPFGEPNHFREGFRHFHIRYGYRPSTKDVNYILACMAENGDTQIEKMKTTDLEDNRLPKFKDVAYPPIEGDYLEYIDTLRTGEWLDGL